MNADTITIEQITELATALGIAYTATQRLAVSCHRGEVSPAEAAAEIAENHAPTSHRGRIISRWFARWRQALNSIQRQMKPSEPTYRTPHHVATRHSTPRHDSTQHQLSA